MKNAIIVHGRGAQPEMHWFFEEKALLEKKGYTVTVPKLTDDEYPKLKDWMDVLDREYLDENTVLIGHSLGTVAALRLLERKNIKVDKVILLAGYARDKGLEGKLPGA